MIQLLKVSYDTTVIMDSVDIASFVGLILVSKVRCINVTILLIMRLITEHTL